MRTDLLRFNGAVERDPAIHAWMKEHSGELGAIAHQSFEVNLRRLDLASNFPQIGKLVVAPIASNSKETGYGRHQLHLLIWWSDHSTRRQAITGSSPR
jgi:hypothetical protein